MADIHAIPPPSSMPAAPDPANPPAPAGKRIAGMPDETVGPRGPLGQPTGLPVPAAPGERDLLTDVLAGLDPSQLLAAEELRARGAASALESLLGLDARPTSIGEFAAPPLFSKMFRNMSPAARRAVMRSLLARSRTELLRLAAFIQDELHQSTTDHQNGDEKSPGGEELSSSGVPFSARAIAELNSVARMLNTIERLLAMQDYALSRTGSFSKG